MALAPLCTGHHYSTMHKILQVTRKNMSNKESGPLILQSHIVTYDIKKNHFVLTFDRSNTLKKTCIVHSYMVNEKIIFFVCFLFVCFFGCLFLVGLVVIISWLILNNFHGMTFYNHFYVKTILH